MSESISEIGDKKNKDAWSQVRDFRDSLKEREAAAGAENQAVEPKPNLVLAGPKDDNSAVVKAIKKSEAGTFAEPPRVNFAAWNISNEEKSNEAQRVASGLSEAQTVGKPNESNQAKQIKTEAGQAAASSAISEVASTNVHQATSAVAVNSGAAVDGKPLRVPGVGKA